MKYVLKYPSEDRIIGSIESTQITDGLIMDSVMHDTIESP